MWDNSPQLVQAIGNIYINGDKRHMEIWPIACHVCVYVELRIVFKAGVYASNTYKGSGGYSMAIYINVHVAS